MGAVVKEQETWFPATWKWVAYAFSIAVLRKAWIVHFGAMNRTNDTFDNIFGHRKAKIVRCLGTHTGHLIKEVQTLFRQFTLLELSVNVFRELVQSLIELV